MAEKTQAKKKRSTAEKRQIQSEKKRDQNKVFKSRVRTAIRKFQNASKSKDESQIQETLNVVFSLMDKGVKKGIYKQNKANRTKSRLHTTVK